MQYIIVYKLGEWEATSLTYRCHWLRDGIAVKLAGELFFNDAGSVWDWFAYTPEERMRKGTALSLEDAKVAHRHYLIEKCAGV